MDCLEDDDISIRFQALDLISKMVTSETLQLTVDRLMMQLQTPSLVSHEVSLGSLLTKAVSPVDSYGPFNGRRVYVNSDTFIVLNHYRTEVIHKILDMCSQNTYCSVVDFEWYLDVLIQLVKVIPSSFNVPGNSAEKLSTRIGIELRNVTVRVKSVQLEATQAAESLAIVDNRATMFPANSVHAMVVLKYVAWIMGEYPQNLAMPDRIMDSLIHGSNFTLPSVVLPSYIQAIPKLFLYLTSKYSVWNAVCQGEANLILARAVGFLEKLTTHSDLDVQERAVEFVELFRLTAEAVSLQDFECSEMPLLISSVIPSLFTGLELNPVSTEAQRKVPIPEFFEFSSSLNPHLNEILSEAEENWLTLLHDYEPQNFYYTQQKTFNNKKQSMITSSHHEPSLYLDSPKQVKMKVRRHEESKDDPFYIVQDQESPNNSPSPFQKVLRNEELDIDAIPVIDLDIGRTNQGSSQEVAGRSKEYKKAPSTPRKVEIVPEATIEDATDKVDRISHVGTSNHKIGVDSSDLTHVSFGESSVLNKNNITIKQDDEGEMANALAEVERLRLEMQRISERVHIVNDIPDEGFIIKKK